MDRHLWKHIDTVRLESPLVHNITNFVVMNNTANALLAIGASPIMAHGHSELAEMVSLCQSTVINIGTLDAYFVDSMLIAARKAHELGKPWVLDPVGAGATRYRNEVLAQLLACQPTVIRGNASEIMALAKVSGVITKGVDSTADSLDAIPAAKDLAAQFGAVVVVSGATDVIVGPEHILFIENGHPTMTRVTGLGCSASALIGAFIAVIKNTFEAVAAATAVFSMAGEIAAEKSSGPGTLQVQLLDALYTIDESVFSNRLKWQEA